MKKKAAKASFLAAFAIFFSTSVAMCQEPSQTSKSPNVTVVPKQPAHAFRESAAIQRDQKRGIEKTIRSQLIALASGNAEAAYANLSPSAQRQFAKPADFLSTVEQQVPPITKTRSFSFVGMQLNRKEAQQQVLLTDHEGRSWLAKFEVVQQPGGDWRVKACVLQDMPGQQA